MKITVVIATYNGEKFLREQIDSVLNQTMRPEEIIVSDDCSTDETWAILEEYQKQYPKLFRLYRNAKGIGPHENFKHAFEFVTGDIVVPCDQDDIWMPEKIERCVATMDEHTSLVFCQETMRNIDGSEKELPHKMPILRKCIFGEVVPGHLIACRKEVLEVYKIAPEITFDWGMTLYAAVHKNGKGIDYMGCIWRRHSATVTTEYEGCIINEQAKISKWRKLIRTLASLRKGEKSEVLRLRMTSIATIIRHYAPDLNEGTVAFCMAEQNVSAMLKACHIYLRVMMNERTFKVASIKQKLGMMAFAYCYPAMYWYDYHMVDAL